MSPIDPLSPNFMGLMKEDVLELLTLVGVEEDVEVLSIVAEGTEARVTTSSLMGRLLGNSSQCLCARTPRGWEIKEVFNRVA